MCRSGWGCCYIMEVRIVTGDVTADFSEVLLRLEEGATCAEAIKELEEELQLPLLGKGAWHLEEDWQGCRHSLALADPIPTGGVVSLHLRQGRQARLRLEPVRGRQVPLEPVRRDNRRKKLSRKLVQQFLESPTHFLAHIKTQHQLSCVRTCLQRRLDGACRQYSATLLQRLGGKKPLWGPQEVTSPLERMLLLFHSLQDQNLTSSTEVSDLNIQSTRLQQQLAALSGRADQLSGELSLLQEEVKRKREERENNAPRNVQQLQAELAKLTKELEMKNQLNASLNSKQQKVKDHLKSQQKVLEEKKKEVEMLRGWDGVDRGQSNSHAQQSQSTSVQSHSNSRTTGEVPHSTAAQKLHSHSADMASAVRPRSKRRTSSKKRHASKFEAKHRQLLEEEGQAFKQHQKTASGDREGVWPQDKLPALLTVPPPDTKWYEDAEYTVGSEVTTPLEPAGETGARVMKPKQKKRVEFEAEAIVLNAALEGELDLLKKCIKMLGGRNYSNDKGATCLHNAVCSGNLECVSYLVDLSCDINAQDIDGWTPLHCAVAYSNLVVTRYLVEHGASLFLTTKEGDTPLHIAEEEHKLVRMGQQDGGSTGQDGTLEAATKCLDYLKGMESGLGQQNGGVVFALFDRPRQEDGELSLTEGERLVILDSGKGVELQWWKVKNGRGQTGEVPFTYLGLYKRITDIL